MLDAPTGTLTLLFTDLEGSIHLFKQLREQYSGVLAGYRHLLRTAFEQWHGHEVDTQGDAFFVAFTRATDAVSAVIAIQRALASHPWPEGVAIYARIGIHTGQPQRTSEGYIGLDVHQAARIMSAGHGGQILLSQSTCALVEQHLPEGMSLRDLGEHRLKDLHRTTRLFQLVVPGLLADFPPLKTLESHPNNLPQQPTALIGRQKEVAELGTLLRRQDLHLVTLTGPAGVGKTRLALQVAAALVDAFADGVFVVPLAPLNDPEYVFPAIMQTLTISEVGYQAPLALLQTHLKERRMLLLLDNFEQVIEAALPLATLLAACPALTVLVTSRAVLHIQAERAFVVPPLSVPDTKLPSDLVTLSQYEAATLFIERAQAVKADFQVTSANAPAVAALCARLDGLPLAIELAAARTTYFSPQALLKQLEQGLSVLSGGARDLPARQQTLRGAIAWSYDLLAPQEQQLFRQLSVFTDGFMWEAAELVCTAAGRLDGNLLEGLLALVDKNLLRQEKHAQGEPRFGMLHLLREFGLECLEHAGETKVTQQAHAAYYLRLAEEANIHRDEAEQMQWLERLEQEHENLRTALKWLLEQTEVENLEKALRLTEALSWLWLVRGYFSEGRSFLEQALVKSAGVGIAMQAKVLTSAGLLALNQDDFDLAEAQLAQALALYGELGEQAGRAHCLQLLGLIAYAQSEYVAARTQFEEAEALYQAIGDSRGKAYCLAAGARVCIVQGEYGQAQALLEESLALCRAVGDIGLMGLVLYLQAKVLFISQTNPERVTILVEQSLARLQEMGEKQTSAYALCLLGQVRLMQGEHADARTLLEKSEELLKAIGDRAGIAEARMDLARVALREGDGVAARRLYHESLVLLRAIGFRQFISAALEGLGVVMARQGEPLAAARLWGAAEALRAAIGTPMPPAFRVEYERAVTAAAAQVEKEAFASTWAAGRALSLEEALIVAGHCSGPDPAAAVTQDLHRDPGLSTRLHPPHPRTPLVHRPHLTQRLQQGMARPLTLVSAPAGFGKTTLLAQWLTEQKTPVAWLSLEPEDNDPTRFLSCVIAALQTVDRGIGSSGLSLLRAARPASPETVLAVVTHELADRAAGNFVLVLDDYHVITADSIHQAMTFLVEHLPPPLHLILSTRADPPLPLARLRARGQLSELRAADLRFTGSEVSAFLQEVMELELPAEAIVALERRTEGWIAGLQLAALSLQGRADIDAFLSAFAGSHRFVLDYLSEEVLLRQDASVQSFLLSSSILDRLCGPLCDAVTGQEGSQTMLEALERANLFVVPLDDERHWYRYHHLFAGVLRVHLQQTQPRLLPELHRRASTWYQQHDMVAEAIQHALAATDVEGAARLIEQHALELAVRGQTQTVLGWLNTLPDALVLARPSLCIAHAVMLMLFTQQAEAAEVRLQEAERLLQTDTPAERARLIRGWAAVIRGHLARRTGDLERTVVLAHQALELLPETEVIGRATALVYTAHAYQVSGDVRPESERLVMVTLAPARASGNLFSMLRSLILLAQMRVLQGRLREAATVYEEAVQAIGGPEILQIFSSGPAYCFGRADALREWNDLEEAERHLAHGMRLLEGTTLVDADFITFGYTALARLLQARGEYSQALVILDAFAALAQQRHFVPSLVARGAAARAQIALAQGNVAAAVRWAEGSHLCTWEHDLSYPREHEYLALARVRIAQGRADPSGPFLLEALEVLDRLLVDADAKARRGRVLELLILQALARDAQGDRKRALHLLERALVMAEPEGYTRLFLDEGEPMLVLLLQAHARSIVPLYVATLLSAFGEQVIVPLPPRSTLLEPLTEREREVLQLLAQGASNREMARRLVVSVSTVKKHLYNICGKLGVHSRTQALLKARTLHLV